MTDDRAKLLYDALLKKERQEEQYAANCAMEYMQSSRSEAQASGILHLKLAGVWSEARRLLQLARCGDGREI